ncbi:hypothetical protein [Corynebacterium ulcerans]|uniref:hypothetical protein n=1 Tax=Corynebacterium ulcerans TaxID=65058 RepID=UPI00184D3D12|nr:hypothetical protein [Corynebacterium ulcerans]NOL58711.1 hypothetical protein [Corynebacterium ulcerans]NOM03238.1 hypothetical protein [Corynebacterium ulcerans]
MKGVPTSQPPHALSKSAMREIGLIIRGLRVLIMTRLCPGKKIKDLDPISDRLMIRRDANA